MTSPSICAFFFHDGYADEKSRITRALAMETQAVATPVTVSARIYGPFRSHHLATVVHDDDATGRLPFISVNMLTDIRQNLPLQSC